MRSTRRKGAGRRRTGDLARRQGPHHREIAAHIADVYGAEVSRDTISRITDRVLEEMTAWQRRPLDQVYPVIFIDAIHVKIRDRQVANRPVCTVTGVTVDGMRDVLGLDPAQRAPNSTRPPP